MKKFDKEDKPKFIVKDILGIDIKVGDYVACASGGYRACKYLAIGTVMKLNAKSIKVKKEISSSYYSEFNVSGDRVLIINEKKDVQV